MRPSGSEWLSSAFFSGVGLTASGDCCLSFRARKVDLWM